MELTQTKRESNIGITGLTRVMRDVQGTDWMLPLFWGIGCKFPNLRVGEIGFRGATSTLAWLLAAQEMEGHVYSMDILACETGLQLVKQAGLSEYLTFIQCDSSATDFPEELDILFIDGDHTYTGVSKDYRKHRENVKDGGLIFVHDTVSEPDVTRFVQDFQIDSIPFGLGLGVEVVDKSSRKY